LLVNKKQARNWHYVAHYFLLAPVVDINGPVYHSVYH